MHFLISGEGPTDIGHGPDNIKICNISEFNIGPMTLIIDRIVASMQGHSIIDESACSFVTKKHLIERTPKGFRFPGKKQAKETLYYERNARTLAIIAKELQSQKNKTVVAILFRDSDGTASSGRGLWNDKLQSVYRGFTKENFCKGVPMIPKPKSEAWLICGLKSTPYHNCIALESRSGNDKSPNSLKKELQSLFEENVTSQFLNEKVRTAININKLDMPSFNEFKNRLTEAID